MEGREFLERLEANSQPVVLDLWAPWCLPCRTIEPVLERLAELYSGKVDIWRLNVDEHIELVQALGVHGIPTLIAFQGSKEIARVTGAQPQARLESLFEAALNGQPFEHRGLLPRDRVLRLVAGFCLVVLGWLTNQVYLFLLIGGAVMFSAVYDRCPIWQALSPSLRRLVRGITGKPGSESKSSFRNNP